MKLFCIKFFKNLKFLTNEEGTIVLDKSNKKLAKLPDIIRIRILDNKLLIFRKDSFLIIDLEDFSPDFLKKRFFDLRGFLPE